MLPPKRYRKRRHWVCQECGADLGAVRTSTGGGKYLMASRELRGAIRIDAPTPTWTLTCPQGHETEWGGAGINWWEQPEAA